MRGLLSGGGVLPNTLAIPVALLYIVTMQTIIETPAYLSDAKALRLTDGASTVRVLDYFE
jgi:hypothetical protein